MDKRQKYFAHTNDRGKEHWQLLKDHLWKTAELARSFGEDAGIGDLSYVVGLLHDLGKYSEQFQARLEGKKLRVDHSTAGAIELCNLYKRTPQEPLAKLLAYCITGHHTGMLDFGDMTDLAGDGTLSGRLKSLVLDYSAYQEEITMEQIVLPTQLALRPIKNNWGFSFAFLTRMVYSALVDADYQETEMFMRGRIDRGGHESIDVLCERFNSYLTRFNDPHREIDQVRTDTLNTCIRKARLDQGFFTLTVPTGGGKTLASMAFALNHAAHHGLKRIIYVIPFTSIIEQNAGVFNEILGEESILEHHSNFDWEQRQANEIKSADNQTNSTLSKLKLAAENWDIPIVVTTNVQFFESLFANRSSRTRKIHNLAKSVVVFDEAQMIPRDYMLPSMYAVRELVVNYGASAVFCTATQPDLGKFLPEGCTLTELAPDPQKLFDFYHRVDVVNLGKLPDEDLLVRLNSHKQALCIVNTRRHARELYKGLTGEGAFHLSTLMCPAHRKQVVKEIRSRLMDGQACRLVSTSVMEAGVDLDFPVGYRAVAGLDSINQAAGRINREMRRGVEKLFIFEPETPHIKKTPGYIAQSIEVTRSVLREFSEKPISIDAIQSYFSLLYSLKNRQDFDYKDILTCFNKSQPDRLDFATAAEKFRIIEDDTVSIIIPYDQSARVTIEDMKATPYPASLLRKLQPYTVGIYVNEYHSMAGFGAIEMVAGKFAVLTDMDLYKPETGLEIPASAGGEGLFF